jgi:hypothetical protein
MTPKLAKLDRMMREVKDAENAWLWERGLSNLLGSDPDDDSDDDTDIDYADFEGAPGLAGLLFYRAPGMEQD